MTETTTTPTDPKAKAKPTGGKKEKGASKKAYYARRKLGLHEANKAKRIAKAARIDKKNADKATRRALNPKRQRGAARRKRRDGLSRAAA